MPAPLSIASVMSGMATANCNLQMKVTVCFIFLVTHAGSEDGVINTAATKKMLQTRAKYFQKLP